MKGLELLRCCMGLHVAVCACAFLSLVSYDNINLRALAAIVFWYEALTLYCMGQQLPKISTVKNG